MRILKTVLAMLLCVAPLSATTYYVDYVGGSDAQDGLAKVHTTGVTGPFKSIPGMYHVATGLAASTVISGGDSIILKGGVSWPMQTTGCIYPNFTYNSSELYIGVDQTWYTGGSWTRPILDAHGVATGACVVNGGSTTLNNIFIILYGPHITIDNIEWKGLLQQSGGGETYFIDGSFGPDYFNIKNNYFHGWVNAGGSPTFDELKAFYRSPGYPMPNSGILDSNVMDGSDTAPVLADPTCTGACLASGLFFYGFATEVKNNIVRYVSNGFIGAIKSYHDNLTEYIRVSINPSNHMNNFENNDDPCSTRVYNNVMRHWSSTSIVGLWVAPHTACPQTYVFNNVIYDTANANMWDIELAALGSVSSINNTVEAGPDVAGPSGQMQIGGPVLTAATGRNNHQISSTMSSLYCPAANCTNTTPLFQSKATANGQGYTSAQMYPFSPTSGAGSSVGTGTNYTVDCAIDADMAHLCYDTTLAVTYDATNHKVDGPGRTPNLRPAGSAWDIGAYQYAGGVLPAPAVRPKVNNSSLPPGIVNVPYSFTLSAVEGSPPYNWTTASFSNGLALSAAGVLAGTPNANGNYIVPVTVNDTKGLSDTAALPLVISQFTPPLSTKYAIGDTFKVVTSGSRLNVRVCPNGAKVSTMNNGATAQITGSAQVSSGATYWPMSRGCVPDIYIRQ